MCCYTFVFAEPLHIFQLTYQPIKTLEMVVITVCSNIFTHIYKTMSGWTSYRWTDTDYKQKLFHSGFYTSISLKSTTVLHFNERHFPFWLFSVYLSDFEREVTLFLLCSLSYAYRWILEFGTARVTGGLNEQITNRTKPMHVDTWFWCIGTICTSFVVVLQMGARFVQLL